VRAGRMVFFRGKFRHVSSSSESDNDDDDAPPPDLIGDPVTESILTVGCLAVGAVITLAVMALVVQVQQAVSGSLNAAL
jgi:hypothetical protein